MADKLIYNPVAAHGPDYRAEVSETGQGVSDKFIEKFVPDEEGVVTNNDGSDTTTASGEVEHDFSPLLDDVEHVTVSSYGNPHTGEWDPTKTLGESILEYDSESAAFNVGETVTGGDSGATAVVRRLGPVIGGIGFIQVDTVSGTFEVGETITGGGSGSTAVLTSPVDGADPGDDPLLDQRRIMVFVFRDNTLAELNAAAVTWTHLAMGKPAPA